MAQVSKPEKITPDVTDRQSLVVLLSGAMDVCLQLNEKIAADCVLDAIRALNLGAARPNEDDV